MVKYQVYQDGRVSDQHFSCHPKFFKLSRRTEVLTPYLGFFTTFLLSRNEGGLKIVSHWSIYTSTWLQNLLEIPGCSTVTKSNSCLFLQPKYILYF